MPFDGTEFLRRHPRTPAPPPGWRARCLAVLRTLLFLPQPTPLPEALLRILEEARGLIAAREDWVAGAYETRGGERCAVGALRAAATLLNYPREGAVAQDLVAAIVRQHGFDAIERMNDHTGHDAILRVFDTAIATTEAGLG